MYKFYGREIKRYFNNFQYLQTIQKLRTPSNDAKFFLKINSKLKVNKTMVYCGAAGMHSSSLKPLVQTKKIPMSIREGFDLEQC